MSRPRRIQRQRVRGWRKPEGAIYVGRPSVWGNPFQPTCRISREYRLRLVREYADALNGFQGHSKLIEYVRSHGWVGPFDRHSPRTFLRGHDLMCWCPFSEPCHADVLLELANA